MMRRKPIFIRLALLAVTLAVPLLPLTAAPPTAAPGTEEAETPETFVRVHVVRTERPAVDPCDFGRLIALQPACTTPEECDAWRLWQKRMPQGPMAAIPVPRGLPNVMPAGAVETEPTVPSDPPTLVLSLEKTGDPDAQVLTEELGERLRARGLEPGEQVEVLTVPHKGQSRRYTLRVPEEGLAPDLLAEPRIEPKRRWLAPNPCPAQH